MGLRIALDLEGVLADSNAVLPKVISERYAIDAHVSFQYQWNILESAKHALGITITPEQHEDIWREVWERWREIECINDYGRGFKSVPKVDSIRALENMGHEVMILTHSFNKNIELDKRAWIDEHFKGARVEWVNGSKGKDQYDFDVFVDDGPHNVVALHRAGKKVIVYTQQWNLGLTPRWYFDRVGSLHEFRRVLKQDALGLKG